MWKPRYQPYKPDSESDSESESEFTDTTDTESDTDTGSSGSTHTSDQEGFQDAADATQTLPDYSAFAAALNEPVIALSDTANIVGTDLSGQCYPNYGYPLATGYPTFSNLILTPDPSGATLQTSQTQVTNIVMIDSKDRDRSVYAQPTDVTLQLPRTYKNITNFQVVQIKLLSAFYYFRKGKENIFLTTLEYGRTIPNSLGQYIDNIITTAIREGTYDINSLLSELTTQMNETPKFYDYINGFQDFALKFAPTGDFSLNFNYPGDTFYDSQIDAFLPNPTIDLIVSKYFVSRYAGLSSYSTSQIEIAYYYPVLKEILLDENYPKKNQLNLTLEDSSGALLPGETVTSRILFTFQGINDSVILEVVENNVALLDEYRLLHTFRYSLINKYNFSYDTYSNKITVSSTSLNTSLVTLITTKQAQFFAEQLNFYGLTQAQYDALTTQNAILSAILNDMYRYYQQWLAVYYGIQFNTFDLTYLANPTLPLPTRDALGASGVSSNYDLNVLARKVPPYKTNILEPFRQPAPSFWNRMSNLTAGTVSYLNPVLTMEDPSKALDLSTWNQELDAADTLHPLVRPNVLDPTNPNTTEVGNLYVNKRTGIANLIMPLNASKYTVFRFKSPVRQTLQVETLPRPTKYRYPAYNAITYDASKVALFDASYAFVSTVANSNMDVSTLTFQPSQVLGIPGFSTFSTTNGFAADLSTSRSYWAGGTTTLSVVNTRAFYEFWTPYPPNFSSLGGVAYTYPMRVTLANADPGQPFTAPLQAFLYHDRAAFMADISGNRKELPIHYINTVSSFTDISAATMEFTAYANQRYYVLVRSQSLSFASQTFQVLPWFPASTSVSTLTDSLAGFDPLANPLSTLSNLNYTQVADPAFIQLPISSMLVSTPATDPSFLPLTFSKPLMGYDVNGVTTDLTNYCGFVPNVVGSNVVPNAQVRIDPANGYLFQANSPYSSTSQTYFYSGSQNSILFPNGGNVYTPSTIAARQTSLVHWYGPTFLPPSRNQLLFPPDAIAAATTTPFTATAPLGAPLAGYSYTDLIDASGSPYLGQTDFLDTGDGVTGIGFLPEQGVWNVDRFLFKSVFTNSNADPNLSTSYLAIFPATVTSNRTIDSLTLSTAVAVLKRTSTATYNSSNQNFGFDANGGSYYEFTRDTRFGTGSNSYLYGYTQSAYEYVFDLNAFYVAVPFTADGRPTYYFGLTGSVVPYPLYSQSLISNAAPSPEGPLAPPNGRDIVLPNGVQPGANPIYGPPVGTTVSQSAYEQSMRVGTNLLLFANPYPITTISTSFDAWNPFPYAPTDLVTDCSGYILLKDSQFRVFSYQSGVSTQTFTEAYQFTLDQVFPPASNIDYLGVAANESNFAFFGLSNAVSTPYLFIRTMNPASGTIQDTFSELSPQGFQSSVQLFRATYNNYGGYVMSCQSYDSNTATTDIQVVAKPTQASSTLVRFVRQASQPDIQYFIAAQSPKEAYGRFWVFPYRTGIVSPGAIPTGVQDFAYVNPNSLSSTAPSGVDYEADVTLSNGGPTFYAEVTKYALSNQAPYTYRSPIVTRDVAQDRIFLLSEDQPTKFYEASTIVGLSTPLVVSSSYMFPSTPTGLYAGANGAKWSLLYDTLYGNRADSVDGPKRASQAWQIFYPVHRVVFTQVAKNFSLLNDLSGLDYPEWPHTGLAVYDGSGALNLDTSDRWGLEASGNFITADFNFSGYYFNTYQYAVPLQDNRSTNDFYYMAARNYTPTEQSQVMLRISLPNKYTFGYVTPIDISGEISTAKYVSTTSDRLLTYYWDPNYVNSLLGFDQNFVFGSTGIVFGGGVVPGYPGSNFSNVTGFGDFYGRFQALYSTFSTQVQLASTINKNVQIATSNFIQTDLQYIIPSTALNRQRFTDPLTYSFLFKSSLLPAYANLETDWGLGWNLGFDKEDTPFNTVQKAQSFFKILDDFINLRLNPEFDMNRMDTTLKEDLSASLEPQGTTKSFYGKLLLANFGSYAQTMISNPLSFSPTLGKLSKLTVQWVDTVGAIIDNSECEWNAVVQIVESVDVTQPPKPPLIDPGAV